MKYKTVIEGKLLNGAQILQSKNSTRWPNTYVVLALWGENSGMPYVTWRVDQERNAHLGHYHDDLMNAARDYNERE